jgi:hypothetical protein
MGDKGPRVSGGILIYRLYDVAWDIDLRKVEEKVREYRYQSIDRDYGTIFSLKHKGEEEDEKSSGRYACYAGNGVHPWIQTG